jgi:membrane fusion protein (multidrug efflux system)
MNLSVLSKYAGLSLMIFSLLFVSGCQKKEEAMFGEMKVNVVGFAAKKQPIEEKINLVGTLEANEQVEIKSEIDGLIEDIRFQEGQSVDKDDILFTIDQTKLNSVVEQAQADLHLAQTTAKRYEELVKNLAVSKQEYDQTVATLESSRAALELAKAQMADAIIIAPFAGTMGERLVSIGQFIAKGTSLGFVVDTDPVKASFHVPERYLGQLKIGQKVEMNVAAYPEESFLGEVYFIDPKVNQETRTALVKALVSNEDGRLRPGMFANLSLITKLRPEAVVIPETALLINLSQVKINVVDEDQTVHSRDVKTGIRFDGMVEIVEGLQGGDIVVIEGTQKVRDGSAVNVSFPGEKPAEQTVEQQVEANKE